MQHAMLQHDVLQQVCEACLSAHCTTSYHHHHYTCGTALNIMMVLANFNAAAAQPCFKATSCCKCLLHGSFLVSFMLP
jgi:hypothetical protein